MGDLTTNFSRSEFACKGKNCCDHSAPISITHVTDLQMLRDIMCSYLGRQIILNISSGFRCRKHNEDEGGAEDSRHPLGDGSDVLCPEDVTLDEFYMYAEMVPGFKHGGIGIYHDPPRLHLDSRGTRARW